MASISRNSSPILPLARVQDIDPQQQIRHPMRQDTGEQVLRPRAAAGTAPARKSPPPAIPGATAQTGRHSPEAPGPRMFPSARAGSRPCPSQTAAESPGKTILPQRARSRPARETARPEKQTPAGRRDLAAGLIRRPRPQKREVRRVRVHQIHSKTQNDTQRRRSRPATPAGPRFGEMRRAERSAARPPARS